VSKRNPQGVDVADYTGDVRFERFSYRGKHYTVPVFSAHGGVEFEPQPKLNTAPIAHDSPIMQTLNTPFRLSNFKVPRKPISLGVLPPAEMAILSTPSGAPRTLDLPIKFPGTGYRLPKELAVFEPIIRRAANFQAACNPRWREYFCYLTVDMGVVKPGQLQREAPCHVDGFQGARWRPRRLGNHTVTVSNAVPTAYYVQPFDFRKLNIRKHDFYWEMNRQVAETNSEFAWYPRDGEMTMMDCYTVHRGTEADEEVFRTFVRISWEVRKFDRLGNAHNPLFDYNWKMVERDIEALKLVAFDPTSDPSLRRFPWQDLDGKALQPGQSKTKPNLRPSKKK
jgi:hypothetical protein